MKFLLLFLTLFLTGAGNDLTGEGALIGSVCNETETPYPYPTLQLSAKQQSNNNKKASIKRRKNHIHLCSRAV
jgi:hypothetical protein